MWGWRCDGWDAGWPEEVGAVAIAGGGSGIKAAAVVVVGAAAGCGGAAGGCPVERGQLLSAAVSQGRKEKRTSLRSILGFVYTPVARSWSFYRRGGRGCCRGMGRGLIGAGCWLRLLWRLLLFAPAEEAAQAFFHMS